MKTTSELIEAAAPKLYHVLSDRAGFVGAFTSGRAARDVVDAHPGVPFVIQTFPVAAGMPTEIVWVVVMRDIEHVAFVSNDIAEATRVHEAYKRIGLVYDDEIGWWRQLADTLNVSVRERLLTETTVLNHPPTAEDLARASIEDDERVARLAAPLPGGPLEQCIIENMVIDRPSILDMIVPLESRTVEFVMTEKETADDNIQTGLDNEL